VQKGRSRLLYTAINANDLRVRAASLEITLAGYNLHKSPGTVESLLVRLQDEPAKTFARAPMDPPASWAIVAWKPRAWKPYFSMHPRSRETTRTYAVIGLGLLPRIVPSRLFLVFSARIPRPACAKEPPAPSRNRHVQRGAAMPPSRTS